MFRCAAAGGGISKLRSFLRLASPSPVPYRNFGIPPFGAAEHVLGLGIFHCLFDTKYIATSPFPFACILPLNTKVNCGSSLISS